MFSHSPPCHPIPTNKNPTQEELPEDVQHRSSDDLDEAKWSSNQPRKANNTYGRVWNLSSRLRYVQRFKGQYSLGLFLMFKYLDLLGLVKVSHHWRVAKVVGFLWLHFFNVRSPEEPPSWLKIHVVPKTVGFTLRPRHNFLKIDGTGFRIPNVWGEIARMGSRIRTLWPIQIRWPGCWEAHFDRSTRIRSKSSFQQAKMEDIEWIDLYFLFGYVSLLVMEVSSHQYF